MFRNKHICCVCRSHGKHVQIHHINGNPSDNSLVNLTVLCLDCHSRVTSNEGLGRRISLGELRKYKREWESLNSGQLVKPESLAKNVEKGLLKADISRLMIQAISLKSTTRRLEAIKQIESYGVYFDVRDFVLKALNTIVIESVWAEPDITAACAKTLQSPFWGLPGPDYDVPLDKEDEKHFKSALYSLQWIAKNGTEELRSNMVQKRLFESLQYLYEVSIAYERHNIALSVLKVVETGLKACYSKIEYMGIWYEGLRIALKALQSMRQSTPSGWEKEIKRIEKLNLLAEKAKGD